MSDTKQQILEMISGVPVQDDLDSLAMYVDNEQSTYKDVWNVNLALAKKKKAGKYDTNKAYKAFVPALTKALKYFKKKGHIEESSPIKKKDLETLAKQYAKDFEAEYDLGNIEGTVSDDRIADAVKAAINEVK